MQGSVEKVYKTRIYRVFANIIFGIGVAIFLWFISSIWLEEPWTYVIGGAVFILYLLLVIYSNIISIHVTENEMIVYKRGKQIHCFNLDECSFESRTRSSSGDTECQLYVICNGETTNIDCELIGIRKFYELIEDLGIVGAKASVTEVVTTKK